MQVLRCHTDSGDTPSWDLYAVSVPSSGNGFVIRAHRNNGTVQQYELPGLDRYVYTHVGGGLPAFRTFSHPTQDTRLVISQDVNNDTYSFFVEGSAAPTRGVPWTGIRLMCTKILPGFDQLLRDVTN